MNSVEKIVIDNKRNLLEPRENKKIWMHRAQGAIALSLGGIFVEADCYLTKIGGILFLIDGVGDLTTGYHHYVFQKAYEGVEYLINKIRKDETDNN